MAKAIIPHFQNDGGASTIKIGVTKFMCVGASAPNDHPHVFLDMGDDAQKVCPYCSTLYAYDADVATDDSVPPNCRLVETV
ncbi:MAG: hypothetical protein COC23_07160 [Hyphomicrobiales bacterium]|nr:MAG: hypothetical protein COC23_07160 [Hyphomicrobiales bacterium]